MAVPRSLRLYALLVAAQWLFFALPGDPGANSVAQAVLWVVLQAVLVLLVLLRGSLAAWAVLLVFTVFAALLLATGVLAPSLTWGVALALVVGQLAALVAPGTRRHLRRGPAAA